MTEKQKGTEGGRARSRVRWSQFEKDVLIAQLREMVTNEEFAAPLEMVELAMMRCAHLVRWRDLKTVPPYLLPAIKVEEDTASNSGIPLAGEMFKHNGKWIINLRGSCAGKEFVVQHVEVDGTLEAEEALRLPTMHKRVEAVQETIDHIRAKVEVEKTPEPETEKPRKQKVVVYGLLAQQAEVLRQSCPENVALNCVKSLKALASKAHKDAVCIQLVRWTSHLPTEVKARFREVVMAPGGVNSAKIALHAVAEKAARAQEAKTQS